MRTVLMLLIALLLASSGWACKMTQLGASVRKLNAVTNEVLSKSSTSPSGQVKAVYETGSSQYIVEIVDTKGICYGSMYEAVLQTVNCSIKVTAIPTFAPITCKHN